MQSRIYSLAGAALSSGQVDAELRRGARLFELDGQLVLVPRIRGARGPQTKPSEQISQAQQNLATTQADVMKSTLAESEADRARRDTLTQPAVDFYTAMASGDQSKMTAAAGPILTQISQQQKAAKENIYNTAPRGAAQELALAQLPISAAGQTASAMGGAYTSSFDKLANLGSGYGSFSLAELGAGMRSGEAAGSSLAGAGQTQGNIMSAQAAKKAATMDFLGQAAGAGGSIASAYIK